MFFRVKTANGSRDFNASAIESFAPLGNDESKTIVTMRSGAEHIVDASDRSIRGYVKKALGGTQTASKEA